MNIHTSGITDLSTVAPPKKKIERLDINKTANNKTTHLFKGIDELAIEPVLKESRSWESGDSLRRAWYQRPLFPTRHTSVSKLRKRCGEVEWNKFETANLNRVYPNFFRLVAEIQKSKASKTVKVNFIRSLREMKILQGSSVHIFSQYSPIHKQCKYRKSITKLGMKKWIFKYNFL